MIPFNTITRDLQAYMINKKTFVFLVQNIKLRGDLITGLIEDTLAGSVGKVWTMKWEAKVFIRWLGWLVTIFTNTNLGLSYMPRRPMVIRMV